MKIMNKPHLVMSMHGSGCVTPGRDTTLELFLYSFGVNSVKVSISEKFLVLVRVPTRIVE